MGDKNLLTWATAGEEDLDQFIIERKNKTGNFEPIDNELAAGSSATRIQYQFVDDAPLMGRNAYRLRIKKKDLSFSFSNTVLLDNVHATETFKVFPNPVNDKFFVGGGFRDHNYSIRLLNTMNQSVKEITVPPNRNGIFEIKRPPGIQSGIYILCIYDENGKQTFKMKMVFL